MTSTPTSSYIKRSLTANHKDFRQLLKLLQDDTSISHKDRIRDDLKQLGVSWYGFSRWEANYLYNIIHPTEKIGGVVYGRHDDGFVMLVATDRRVIFLDKKPLFINEEELTYDVVSGVSLSHAGFGSTMVLHTRVKDFKIRTFNLKCALGFVAYIEKHRLEQEINGVKP